MIRNREVGARRRQQRSRGRPSHPVTIVVLGHTACGAVKAAMAGTAVPGQFGSPYPYLRPAVLAAKGGDLAAAIAANVRHQVDIMENALPVLAQRVKSGNG